MRKKFLTGILPFMLLLSACSSVKGGDSQVSRPEDLVEIFGSAAEGDKTQEPEATVQPDGGAETPAPAPEEGNLTYKEIYAQAVSETDSAMFSLIYLDNDDIPELVVSSDESYSIYTVKENAIFCVADSLTTVELTYFERTGIVCGFDRWNGGGDEGGYGEYYYQTSKDGTLANDAAPILSFDYNAVYDEEGNYTGTGIVNYYYMRQEIDEASYKEMQSSLGITADGKRLCLENALGKEEMLAALSR